MLVLAHTHYPLLSNLITQLTKDFDVYLHVDRASDISVARLAETPSVTPVKSRRTYWGSFQGTLAMLDLLRDSHAHGYDRYIFISGQDVPLVANDAIRKFFRENQHLDFVESKPLRTTPDADKLDRITRAFWHAPYRHTGLRRMLYNLVEYSLELGYRTVLQPKIIVGDFFWGEQWFGLRHDTVSAIFEYLRDEPEFIRLFRGSRLGEELFVPTLVRRILPKPLIANHTTSYVDWVSGPEKPRVLDHTDLAALEKSPHLFARKVHPEKSAQLLKVLREKTASPGEL